MIPSIITGRKQGLYRLSITAACQNKIRMPRLSWRKRWSHIDALPLPAALIPFCESLVWVAWSPGVDGDTRIGKPWRPAALVSVVASLIADSPDQRGSNDQTMPTERCQEPEDDDRPDGAYHKVIISSGWYRVRAIKHDTDYLYPPRGDNLPRLAFNSVMRKLETALDPGCYLHAPMQPARRPCLSWKGIRPARL
ncbi:hypothetical protein B0H63DRAFT_480297 [Podospora didyma]|uniref:Uncharacterized protein n=1 Tax=Podospora didyma TaxID=330526 RepID=A0AAE0NC54_9PEZI|nr:hypothetical protein B0H63DRAFT_480297 [Podospora didyma]